MTNVAKNAETTMVDDVNSYMRRVYNYMTVGLGISGLVAYIISAVPALTQFVLHTPFFWVALLAPLVMIFFFSDRLYNASPQGAQLWFWIFAALEGLSLSIFFVHFTGVSIIKVFFITSAMFAGLSLYGYTTKRDMSGWGKFLFIALIGLIVAMIVNLFIASAQVSWLISVIAVVLFAALIAYDTQRIKDDYLAHGEVGNSAVSGALSLYLDFINMFIHLLNIFGIANND